MARDRTRSDADLRADDANGAPRRPFGIPGAGRPVARRDGTVGAPGAVIDALDRPAGVLRWHSDLVDIYDDPGNVSDQRWCCGMLIAENLFLTAGHAFDRSGGFWRRPRINGAAAVIPPATMAQHMNVEFGFRLDGAGLPEAPVAVEALLEYRLGGLDFAILRLAGRPGRRFGIARLAADDARPGEAICIIGHRGGGAKRIETEVIGGIGSETICYRDTETLARSSGAGILRGRDGRLIGLHVNGGGVRAMTGTNTGLPIGRIRAVSPTVAALALAHHGDTSCERTTRPFDGGRIARRTPGPTIMPRAADRSTEICSPRRAPARNGAPGHLRRGRARDARIAAPAIRPLAGTTDATGRSDTHAGATDPAEMDEAELKNAIARFAALRAMGRWPRSGRN